MFGLKGAYFYLIAVQVIIIKFFKKNHSNEIFFIMGADNLINFHKWNNWSKIGSLAKILVFDRSGYKKRSKESVAYKNLKKRGLKYISFNKVNISSSQIRNI